MQVIVMSDNTGYIFGTPIKKIKLNTMCEDRISHTLELIKKYDYTGHDPSQHSSLLDHPLLLDVKREAEKECYEYSKLFNHRIDGVEIVNSWSNILQDTGIPFHVHSNSYLNGSIYLEDNSIITFKNDSQQFFIEPACYDDSINYLDLNIDSGTLLLFPSKLTHGVLKKNINEKRYTIAFNTFPTRKNNASNSIENFIRDPYFL